MEIRNPATEEIIANLVTDTKSDLQAKIRTLKEGQSA